MEHFVQPRKLNGASFPCGQCPWRARACARVVGFPNRIVGAYTKRRQPDTNSGACSSYSGHSCTIEAQRHVRRKPWKNWLKALRFTLAVLGLEGSRGPHAWCETCDMFFAQSRQEKPVWGAFLVEHAPSSTVEKPALLQTYFVVESHMLDHTSRCPGVDSWQDGSRARINLKTSSLWLLLPGRGLGTNRQTIFSAWRVRGTSRQTYESGFAWSQIVVSIADL